MRRLPMIRIRPTGQSTPVRMDVGQVGRVFNAPGAEPSRMVELRATHVDSNRQPYNPAIPVSDKLADIEAQWPGFVRVPAHANDGGLEFLLNADAITQYGVLTVRDAAGGQPVGEAVGVHLAGRKDPILVGLHWGQADEKIQTAMFWIDRYLMGRLDAPEIQPDAGLSLA